MPAWPNNRHPPECFLGTLGADLKIIVDKLVEDWIILKKYLYIRAL
jgi:hypothetical protein